MANAYPIGRKIVGIRYMTAQEMKEEEWAQTMHGPPTVIVLDDGGLIFASRDEEGNGPGAIFGRRPEYGAGFVRPE